MRLKTISATHSFITNKFNTLEINVLLLVYRRLEKAKELYEVLRKIKPSKLFISANAPANSEEEPYCLEIRKLFSNPDWECEVFTLFQNEHIKDCSASVTTGINWFFSKVEKGIILEDDCIPDPTFFSFCNTMLDKYENDSGVMHISGTNLLRQTDIHYDYFFSKIILPCWGWASWKRAWKQYTPLMNNWKNHPDKVLNALRYKGAWANILEKNQSQLIGWDLQWMVDIWINDAKGIIPSRNLVKNIGFDKYATLTTLESSKFAMLPTNKLTSFNRVDSNNYDDQLEKLIIEFIEEL